MGFYLPVLKMPNWLREVLSTPLGRIYCSRKTLTSSDIGFADICVGDIVSENIDSTVKVYDYTTRREVLEKESVEASMYQVYNPRSTISLFSKTVAIQHSVFKNVLVIGEEDLLTLAYALSSKRVRIAYGQPGAGVVVVDNDRFFKIRVTGLLKTFKPDIVCIDGECME